ncbi:MAG TPA: hypothetical protein VNR36_04570 [Pseudolysinimonas sp.]|nr:hypothetical protein [Pseudolysinimonas sp.]
MTTFQDPPLHSRRAVRQSERDSAPAAVVPTAGPPPMPVAPAAPAEPLTYTTQGRIPVPDYDGPGLRTRRTPDEAPAPEADGSYRPRDFSPEGRRAAAPAWAPHYAGADPAAAPVAQPSAETVQPSALDNAEPVEHTLTRRELRALRDAHGITAAPEDAAPAHPGTPLAAPSTRLDSAVAEFDQLTGRTGQVPLDQPPSMEQPSRGRRAAPQPEPVAETPVSPAPPAAPPVAAPAPASAPAVASGPARIAPEALGPVPVLNEPPAPAAAPEPEVVVAEIVVEPELTSAPTPEASTPEASTPESTPEPTTSTPPTGHWSTQAQLDDETQVGDAPLARNIGATSGAITTSALVLPSIPNQDFGPIGTGDIMVTGSISLPPSLSATGALPAQLDESDLDHVLDPGDSQVASTDSQPVRAIKAVSTHTSSRGVIQTVKPKGTRGLTALIVAATSMAVIVGALFIVLVATGQL